MTRRRPGCLTGATNQALWRAQVISKLQPGCHSQRSAMSGNGSFDPRHFVTEVAISRERAIGDDIRQDTVRPRRHTSRFGANV